MKRLLRKAPMQAAIAWLAAQYIRVVFATSRWTMLGREHTARLQDDGKPLIGCFWHGRMLMMPQIWTFPAPIHMLVSDHQDGRLIARVIARFGVGTITGSSSRRGAVALRAMAQVLAERGCVAVTPDGPRGPRMRAAPGIVLAAKLADVPIVPVTYSSSRAITLSTWDRFLVALPFGRGVFIWGEPVAVPTDANEAALDGARRAIEARLNQMTREADRMCGRDPVEPAPPRLAAEPA